MSEHFSEIWKKRNSTNPDDQTALYLKIQSIFATSPSIFGLNIKDRDDFFQDFYINKIFHALATGLAITSPSYDDMSSGQLIHMMKQYNINRYRKEKNKISSDQDKTEDVDDKPLIDSKTDVYQQYSLTELTDKAILFIVSSEAWVQALILKSARGDKLSGNDYPRRAKLGFSLKKSFHTGAKSINDYHKKTMIGRWIIATYGDGVLPISGSFLLEIIKSLHQAALNISKDEH